MNICKVLGAIALIICSMNTNAQSLGSIFGDLINTGSVHPINNHVIFEGRTKKKLPAGTGRLHCMSIDHTKYKENYNRMFDDKGNFMTHFIPVECFQDKISGNFDGGNVSNANVEFYNRVGSKWTYKGNMIIQCSDNVVNYILLPKGVLNLGKDYKSQIIKSDLILVDTVVVKRKFDNFSLEFPYMKMFSHLTFNTDNSDITFFGMPTSFFKKYAIVYEMKYDNGWQFKCNASYPGIKMDQSEEILYQVENCKSSKVIFEDNSWYKIFLDGSRRARISFSTNLKDGAINTSIDTNKENITHANIKFKNGDVYTGTIKYVSEKNGNHKVRNGQGDIAPSIIDTDPYYFKNLSISDNIIFVDGTYTFANGTSTTYVSEYDDNERNQMALAQEARAKAAKQASEEAAKKSANQIATTKKLLTKLWGKTYKYTQYYSYYSSWQKTNGNASIKFLSNGQDIFLDVGSSSTWLKFSNITNEGELSCRDVRDGIGGTCYITPYLNNGEMSFIIYYPAVAGGFKYRLSK